MIQQFATYIFAHPSTIAVIAHYLILVFLSIRVIMRKPPVGVALAWVFLISATSFVGAIIYVLVGERRIDHRRFLAIKALKLDYEEVVCPEALRMIEEMRKEVESAVEKHRQKKDRRP